MAGRCPSICGMEWFGTVGRVWFMMAIFYAGGGARRVSASKNVVGVATLYAHLSAAASTARAGRGVAVTWSPSRGATVSFAGQRASGGLSGAISTFPSGGGATGAGAMWGILGWCISRCSMHPTARGALLVLPYAAWAGLAPCCGRVGSRRIYYGNGGWGGVSVSQKGGGFRCAQLALRHEALTCCPGAKPPSNSVFQLSPISKIGKYL